VAPVSAYQGGIIFLSGGLQVEAWLLKVLEREEKNGADAT
jgi:hypothetical protein